MNLFANNDKFGGTEERAPALAQEGDSRPRNSSVTWIIDMPWFSISLGGRVTSRPTHY